MSIKTVRNLTPDEVERVLDALEDMIAWTQNAGFATAREQRDFFEVRHRAHKVWSQSVHIIDDEDELSAASAAEWAAWDDELSAASAAEWAAWDAGRKRG